MDIDVIGGKRCLVFPAGDPMSATLRTIRADETMQKFSDEEPGHRATEIKRRYGLSENTLGMMERFGLFNISGDYFDRLFSTTTKADHVIDAEAGVEIVVFVDGIEVLD